MPQYPDGTEIHQAEWQRLTGSIPADYTIFFKEGIYYAESLVPGGTDYSGATKATIQQDAVDALATGGTIYLKEITLDGTVTYGNTILIIEDYQGIRKIYSNQGRHRACPLLAVDPSTAGWGASQKAFWWFNTTAGVYKYWDGSSIQTLEHGTPAGAHTILSATHTDTLADSILRGDILVGNATPKLTRLPIGAAGKVLKSDGTDATWQDSEFKLAASYTVYKDGVTYYAQDEDGNIAFNNSDARIVLEACANALGLTGGLIRVLDGRFMISKGVLRGGMAFYCGCTIGDPNLDVVAKVWIVGNGPATIFSPEGPNTPEEPKQRVFSFFHAPDCALLNCTVDGQDKHTQQYPNSADGMVVFDNGSHHGLIEKCVLMRGFNCDGAGVYQANYCTFRNNEVDNNEHGLVLTESIGGKIEGNHIHDNDTNGAVISSIYDYPTKNSVKNNIIVNCDGNGVEIVGLGSYNTVSENEIEGCNRGIVVLSAFNIITENSCKANVNDGILIGYTDVTIATDNIVSENKCLLSTDVTNGYGIREWDANADANLITDNKISGNAKAPALINGINSIWRNNSGFFTERGSSAIIASGNTSIAVAHLCDYTPNWQDIDICLLNACTSDIGYYWFDTITSTHFTIHVLNPPGASTASFKWSVRKI